MVKLIGNKTGISGIYDSDDNIDLVENLNDLRRYVYNSLSNTNIPGLLAGVTDLYLSPDESKIYFSNATSDLIYQYNISGFDITPDYYDLKSFSITAQEVTPNGLFFKDDGTKVYIVGQTNDRIYQYSLGTPWDISTASYDSKSFSVTTQETSPNELFFKADGTKVYIVGQANDTIYQYSLGTAWDISTASYDTKSFSVATQEISPTGLFFKSDGTKVYIVGLASDTIYQYALGTPWDISTASYDSKSFSVTAQETSPTGLFFKSDGTKVYIVGSTNDTIYQYSLGTAWDISTASYDTKSFSISAQETVPNGLFFKSDGTKVYIVGQTNDTIYQYSLGTPWDISTARVTPSLFVGNLETSVQSLSFKPDGTKVYIVGQANDTIYQYSLGTAWDISTASYDSKSFSVTAQESAPTGLFFKSDGTKVYIVGTTNDTIYQYSLGTAWDISTASYDTKSFSVTAQETLPTGLFFKSDGTKVYIVGSTSERVFVYTLTTAWDISTAIPPYDTKSFSVAGQEIVPSELFFKDDGTKVYIVGTFNRIIYQYSLGTAWDISTASYDTKSFSVAGQETSPQGLFFKSDGTKVYIVGTTNDTIYQYSLGTAWDISTASYDTKSFSVTTQETGPTGLFFKDDGTKVYIVGITNRTIYQYSLSVAWDISTASYDTKSFSVAGQETSPQGLFFKSDGTKVYIVGTTNDTIYQYSLGTAWDISTASYDTKSFSVTTQETGPTGLFFKSDGTKVYIVGSTSDTIYQYSLGTAWELSSILSYTLFVGTQDGTPNGITFSNDLSKLYMVGATNRALHQYDLLN